MLKSKKAEYLTIFGLIFYKLDFSIWGVASLLFLLLEKSVEPQIIPFLFKNSRWHCFFSIQKDRLWDKMLNIYTSLFLSETTVVIT